MNDIVKLYLISLCFYVNNVMGHETKYENETEAIIQHKDRTKTVTEQDELEAYQVSANDTIDPNDDVNLTDENIDVKNNSTLTYEYVDVHNYDTTNDDYVDVNNNDYYTYDQIEDYNYTLSDKDEFLVVCNSIHNKLSTIEGDVIQTSYYAGTPNYIAVEKCRTNIKVHTKFNSSLTVIYPEMYVTNTKWTAIPESAVVEEVYMKRVTPIGVFGGCSRLTKLSITTPNLTLVSTNWLLNCTQLSILELKNVTVAQLRTILDSAPKIEEVSIKLLSDVANLVHTPIFPSARGTHEWITKFEIGNYKANDINPEEDKSNAMDMSESLLRQLSLLPQLEFLKLANFNDLDFCYVNNVNITKLTLPSLQTLQLYETRTRKLCFKELRKMPKLTNLGLDQNFDIFEFGELYSVPSPVINVQLGTAKIEKLIFSRDDYLALTDGPAKGNITINIEKSIECECETSLWLARALLDGVLSTFRLLCLDSSSLEDQRCDYLQCERINCDSKCLCCVDYPNTFIGDCRNANISSFPFDLISSSNMTALLVPYNKLTTLPKSLPKNLTWLDLSGNDLLRKARETELATLFEIPERHMLLSGNSIICSCDSQNLIAQLQEHQDQIEDYEHLVCAGDNTNISEVDVQGLCTFRNRQKAIIVSVSLLLLLALSILLFGGGFYYRRSIQIFLYARGWCLFCIEEEEMDANRRYDVFVSFCHDDETLVTEELIPVLDQEYSVCVHYRDWCPGGMIPEQITTSIEQSRRTVVVLSRSFVKSLWGLLEFRTAHISGLIEGRVRVVMVVLDDVLDDENIEGELKAYVRLNTYVKWGDPWFWDKLKFSLPHKPTPFVAQPSRYTFNNDRQLGMIEMYDVEYPN